MRFALVEKGARRQERTGTGTGIGAGDRRAVAHRHRGGHHDFADRAGRAAVMIHLPASVRPATGCQQLIVRTLCVKLIQKSSRAVRRSFRRNRLRDKRVRLMVGRLLLLP